MKTKSGVSLGISLPYSFPDARVDHAYIRKFVRDAEALGFDDGWLTEGILNPNFVLEPVTYIAHLAALTEKIRFGISVIILNHRNPIQLAKQLATVDHLSNGRLTVGFGFGAGTSLYPAFGIGQEKRVTRFEEAMRVMTALWTQERVTLDGQSGSSTIRGCSRAPCRSRAYPCSSAATRSPRCAALSGWPTAGWRPDPPAARNRSSISQRCKATSRKPVSILRAFGFPNASTLQWTTTVRRPGRSLTLRSAINTRGVIRAALGLLRRLRRSSSCSGASSTWVSTTSCSTRATSMRARWRYWPR